MAVHVDEAGRDDQARGVDLPDRRELPEVAHGVDPAVVDRDVGRAGRAAAPVDERAAAYDQLDHGWSGGCSGSHFRMAFTASTLSVFSRKL